MKIVSKIIFLLSITVMLLSLLMLLWLSGVLDFVKVPDPYDGLVRINVYGYGLESVFIGLFFLSFPIFLFGYYFQSVSQKFDKNNLTIMIPGLLLMFLPFAVMLTGGHIVGLGQIITLGFFWIAGIALSIFGIFRIIFSLRKK